MPHSPAGFGSIAPPISANPSISSALKALRSIASDMAFLISGLSNGGLTRFTIRLGCVPVVIFLDIAFGGRALVFLIWGMLTSAGKVVLYLPVAKTNMWEGRLLVIL